MKECAEQLRIAGKAYPRYCAICGLGPCRMGAIAAPLTQQEAAVFDALWEVCKDHRLEALTASGSRYAITGDIVRQMAKAAVAAMTFKPRMTR